MKKCECGAETRSVLDIISFRGLAGSRPCCRSCYKRLKEGARLTKDGDIIDGQALLRWHNRDYAPMAQLAWLFHLSGK